MIIPRLFLFCLLFTAWSCTTSPNSKLSEKETFGRERDKKIHSALKKFKGAMEAKGYRVAGIGEGIDHRTGKQNYLGVTLDVERLPNIEKNSITVKSLPMDL